MTKRKKIEFTDIEQARTEAGFFVDDLCRELGISERTWYRWRRENSAPRWVLKAVEILSGRLDFQGWKGWRLCDGVLYNEGLNAKYYSWEPADLMVSVFCDCPGHRELSRRKFARSQNDNAGRKDEAAKRGLHGACAPAFHLPGSLAAVGRSEQ